MYVRLALLFTTIIANINTQTTVSHEISNKIIHKYLVLEDEILYAPSDTSLTNLHLPATVYSTSNPNQLQNRNYKYFKRFTAYIIITKQSKLVKLFKNLRKMDRWNSRSKFIITYEGDLTFLFATLAEYFVYNVAVVNLDKLYTYNPYQYENFLQPQLGPIEIHNETDLFFNKIPKWWRNSTVRVNYMHVYPYIINATCGTGLEIQLVDLMRWFMKFEVSYAETSFDDWGSVYPNGTYTGALVDVQKGTADFVIGHFHIREIERLIDFDFTFSYMDDDLCWAVPRALFKSHWDNIIDIFKTDIWVLIFISLLAISIAWYFVNTREHWLDCLEVSFLSILGMPTIIGPSSLHTKLLFLATWIFSFITMTAWRAYLIFYLTHDTYGFQITNVKELVQSNIIFGLHPELRALHKDQGTPEGDYIYKTADPTLCDATHKCLDRTAYSKDMGTIATKRMYNYLSPQRYRTPTGKEMIYVFNDCLEKDYTVQYYTKGHPLFPRINDFLIWIRTSGFMDNLDNKLKHDLELSYHQYVASLALFETKSLGMVQMQGPFVILGVGMCLALISFIGELVYVTYIRRFR